MTRSRKFITLNKGTEELEANGSMWIPYEHFQKINSLSFPRSVDLDGKFIRVTHTGRDSPLNFTFVAADFEDSTKFSINSADVYRDCCLNVPEDLQLTPASQKVTEERQRKRSASNENSSSDSSTIHKKRKQSEENLADLKKNNEARVRILKDANCHICHSRKDEVYNGCPRGFRNHSYCLHHAISKLELTREALEKDLSVFPPCPPCQLTCPCSACKRRKQHLEGPVETKEVVEISDEEIHSSHPDNIVRLLELPTEITVNGPCHICHSRQPKVFRRCPKGRTTHSYCEKHVSSKLGVSAAALNRDPNLYFPICPVCELTCPCNACQRKKEKTKALLRRENSNVPTLTPAAQANSFFRGGTTTFACAFTEPQLPPPLSPRRLSTFANPSEAAPQGSSGDPWTDIGYDSNKVAAQKQQDLGDILEKRGQSTDQIAIREDYENRLMDAFEPERKGILNVLEVGCGTGVVTRALAGLQEISKIIGLDPSPILIQKAKSLIQSDNEDHSKISFVMGNARCLPFPEDNFDLVVFHTTLIHIPKAEIPLILKEAHRVVNKGGIISIFDNDPAGWNIRSSDYDPLDLCVRVMMNRGDRDIHMCQKLPLLLTQAGFICENDSLKKYTILDSDAQSYGMTVVLRGAETLFKEGHASADLANELKREAKSRAAKGMFHLNMCYAHCFGVKEDDSNTVDDDTVDV